VQPQTRLRERTLDKKITLYLQQAIQFADAVSYGTPNLGGLAAIANNAMNGGGSALGGMASGIMGMLSQAMGDTKAAASTPLARLGTAYVTGFFGETKLEVQVDLQLKLL
jgi:hypothetical protein